MPGMTTDHPGDGETGRGDPERSGPRFAVGAERFPAQGPVALLPIFLFASPHFSVRHSPHSPVPVSGFTHRRGGTGGGVAVGCWWSGGWIVGVVVVGEWVSGRWVIGG